MGGTGKVSPPQASREHCGQGAAGVSRALGEEPGQASRWRQAGQGDGAREGFRERQETKLLVLIRACKVLTGDQQK